MNYRTHIKEWRKSFHELTKEVVCHLEKIKENQSLGVVDNRYLMCKDILERFEKCDMTDKGNYKYTDSKLSKSDFDTIFLIAIDLKKMNYDLIDTFDLDSFDI